MITTGPVDQTLNTGMVLELNCTAVNNDGATRPLVISWMFTPLSQSNPRYYNIADSEVTQTVDNDTVTSVLRIDSVVFTNSGMYVCHAYNRNLQDAVVENATVTVFCELPICIQCTYMHVYIYVILNTNICIIENNILMYDVMCVFKAWVKRRLRGEDGRERAEVWYVYIISTHQIHDCLILPQLPLKLIYKHHQP